MSKETDDCLQDLISRGLNAEQLTRGFMFADIVAAGVVETAKRVAVRTLAEAGWQTGEIRAALPEATRLLQQAAMVTLANAIEAAVRTKQLDGWREAMDLEWAAAGRLVAEQLIGGKHRRAS